MGRSEAGVEWGGLFEGGDEKNPAKTAGKEAIIWGLWFWWGN